MNVRSPWFAAGVLAGCAAGAALGLLYAPMPGRDLLAAIREHVERAKQDAREAGRQTEADILTRYRTIRNAATAGHLGVAETGAARP